VIRPKEVESNLPADLRGTGRLRSDKEMGINLRGHGLHFLLEGSVRGLQGILFQTDIV
jgi:hypothetical protein